MKKKQAAEKRRKEREERKKKAEAEGKEVDDEKSEEEEEPKKDESEEEAEEEDVKEEDDEEPPKVDLDDEEKKAQYRLSPIPDLTPAAMSLSFTKFSVPDKNEGFDDISFEWYSGTKCKEYLKQWVLDRKLTTRIEDIAPGEWFKNKWNEWQKVLQTWRAKQQAFKHPPKTAAPKSAAKPKEGDEKDGDDKEEEEKKEEEKKSDDEMDDAMEAEELDIFAVEDVNDMGDGSPLYKEFQFEDWALLTLRFELHVLAHAFRKDADDPDRSGIHESHLPFYYNRYFKKELSYKAYAVGGCQDLVELVRDAISLNLRSKVIDSMLKA